MNVRSIWGVRSWMHAPPSYGENSAPAPYGPSGDITWATPIRTALLELREAVCAYLQAARAVRCEPGQVVITAGTQQALIS
jgi:hypothetical protein